MSANLPAVPVPLRRILVALDGSARAEQILPRVEGLALAARAKVTVLRVYPEPALRTVVGSEAELFVHVVPPRDTLADVRNTRHESEHYLDDVVARLRQHGVAVDQETLAGEAGEIIVDEAEGIHADLIALTMHGHGGGDRRSLGSVAEYVLHHASCPILLIRAA
jgi:nucleotide-binding universal stress UspA family protein